VSNGAIQSLQVTARYRPDLPPALSDVTFTVKPGQKVGICGRTGSGKSTLLGVLWRLIEQDGGRGTISVDGVNIRDVTLQDYIGVLIPQGESLVMESISGQMPQGSCRYSRQGQSLTPHSRSPSPTDQSPLAALNTWRG
jgi:ATP-binding cassette subfamily C (CFTR/MRP) protein 1